MYLLIKNENIIECSTLLEVASNFNIEISSKGEVFCDGVKDTVSYKLSEISNEEIINYFIKHRFSKVIKHCELYDVIKKF